MPPVRPGHPYPLGAQYDGAGTNFSLFSEVAERVELSVFDFGGNEVRVELPEVTGFCWHGYVPNLPPGTLYGFRVHGPYDPASGVRCNPNKLLLDPYAKAIDGDVDWHESIFPYRWGEPDVRNDLDSGPFMPRSVVVSPYFDWGVDRPPRTPLHESVIYELHVKGFTARHPEIPNSSEEPMPGWLIPSPSTTSPDWASPLSNFFRSTSSSMMPTSWNSGCATTGDTTRSDFWRRTTGTRARGRWASRCRSSSSW